MEAKLESALRERLTEIVGAAGVLTEPADMAPFLVDERARYRGATPAVVRPATTEEVARIVALCAAEKIPIVPQGGNTGLCGGATPNASGRELVVSLARLNRVREVDPLNYTITVEAGVILADVQKAAAEADRLFPLSLGGEGTARIGGNLSTNAGGTGVLRYGNARDLALGLEVVLPDGRVWDGLSALRKDNTGYDLKHLFIGAEGTLGIITAAVLKLFPRPHAVETALVALDDPAAAVALLARARAATGDRVTAFELILRLPFELVLAEIPGTRDPFAERHPCYVLAELSAGAGEDDARGRMESLLAAAMEDGLVRDAVIAESGAQAADFWKLRGNHPRGPEAGRGLDQARHLGPGIAHPRVHGGGGGGGRGGGRRRPGLRLRPCRRRQPPLQHEPAGRRRSGGHSWSAKTSSTRSSTTPLRATAAASAPSMGSASSSARP